MTMVKVETERLVTTEHTENTEEEAGPCARASRANQTSVISVPSVAKSEISNSVGGRKLMNHSVVKSFFVAICIRQAVE